MFDLINIFDTFLPQLLLYPNPTDPLNGESARLLLKDEEKYKEKVKEYVKKYASENSKIKQIDVVNGTVEINGNSNIKEKEDEHSEASELSNASVEMDSDGNN
jgi:hypothetical protein